MKKLSLILLAFFAIPVVAQQTIDDLVQSHDPVVGYIGAKITAPRYDEYAFEPAKFSEFYSLMNKDIYGWFPALNDKYRTELQREAFETTQEYKDYKELLDKDYGLIIGEYQYVYLYSLSYAEYKKDKKAFVINSLVHTQGENLYNGNADVKSLMTTPHFTDPLGEEGPYESAPADNRKQARGGAGYAAFSGKTLPLQSRVNLAYLIRWPSKLYSEPYILLPQVPVDMALKMEENLNDCCILFIVEFEKTSRLGNGYNYNSRKPVIFLKPHEAYIVNRKTKEIYCDITSQVCKGKKKK